MVQDADGERWDHATDSWQGDGALDVPAAAIWVEQGARFVGGCCWVGPDRIAALATHLQG